MFQEIISNLPWLQILVASIAYFALGAIWYGPLFSKAWIRGHGININDADAKKGVAQIMITSFFILVVICISLAIIQDVASINDTMQAVKWGAFLGLGFATTSTSMTYVYLKKPVSTHLIDGLYHVVGMIIALIIMANWQ
ncbi:MAG: hypothetical protein K0Q66_761 [Chitinophagaceae bacterium]|jgi:hypothetical protein|nr:hypothetical protein [Chitinophagaceae bacterium]